MANEEKWKRYRAKSSIFVSLVADAGFRANTQNLAVDSSTFHWCWFQPNHCKLFEWGFKREYVQELCRRSHTHTHSEEHGVFFSLLLERLAIRAWGVAKSSRLIQQLNVAHKFTISRIAALSSSSVFGSFLEFFCCLYFLVKQFSFSKQMLTEEEDLRSWEFELIH